MNRTDRDKFVSATDQKNLAYSESACVETPPEFFDALNAHFHFDVDLCANEQNHLLPNWYGPGSPYSLPDVLAIEDWSNGGMLKVGFDNPPYGDFVPRMLHKSVEQSAKGFTSVHLLPMRASAWYTRIILAHADFLWHLEPRLTFWWNGAPKPTAKKKATKKDIKQFGVDLPNGEGNYIDMEGYWRLRGAAYMLEPANALFDSIVVGFTPSFSMHKVPYTVMPKVWRWKTQDPKELLR